MTRLLPLSGLLLILAGASFAIALRVEAERLAHYDSVFVVVDPEYIHVDIQTLRDPSPRQLQLKHEERAWRGRTVLQRRTAAALYR